MSKVINIQNCFPPDKYGKRGPLPKQQQFLEAALDPKGPSYILYSGGVGSGKTLIGCITILSMAIMESGDYLVCRLFNPELRLTTYKTFLDICPPELIVEHRVADQIIKIRARDGKISNIIFRGADEPDKMRSLNLNAAYLDEASQISEEAFILFQSRLRGRAYRKIIATTNPNGHSWLYRYWVLKQWGNESVKRKFLAISAPSTENIHLPEGYVEGMLSTWTEDRISREVMGSWDAFSGQVYSEFRRDKHVIQPFAIPDEWTRFIGADHGFRNPTAWVWCAADYDGNVYVYREFYEKEWIIEEICKGNPKTKKPGVVDITGKEKIQGIWIDPSTRANRGKDSDYQTYLDHLPKDWSLIPANNEVEAGIDRVKQYMKLNEKTGKPQLFIFNTCVNLIEELTQYRYEELPAGMEMMKNQKEAPVKKDDHSCFTGDTPISVPGGTRPIRDIRKGDLVLTSLGYRPVLKASYMGIKPVWEYKLTDGASIRATIDHPVLTASGAKLPIHDLTPKDILVYANTEPEYKFMGNLIGEILRLFSGKNNMVGNFLSKTKRQVKFICNAATRHSSKDPMVSVQQKEFVGEEGVYNLSVDGVSEYFANGILVSNCDALRYAIMSRPESPKIRDIEAQKRKQETLSGSVMREWDRIRNPVPKDPFGDT